MNTKPLVSILIPAYNAEKTIESCLDSIIVQESNNYEIVVIDDGSSDNTYSRLLKYKDKSQVTIIRQENKGVSLTRQALIENACGKYVLFCDADDFLAPTAIQSVCSVLPANDSDKKSKADLYVFGYNLVRIGEQKSVLNRNLKPGLYGKNEYAKYHVRGFDDLYYSALWNKCYRRELFFKPDKLIFETLIEDVMFNVDYINRCESIYLSNEIIYNYNQIGESLTRSNRGDTGTDIQSALDAFLVFYDKALETYHEYEMYIGRYICLKLLQLKKRAKNINDCEREKQIQVVLEKYRSHIGFQYYIALFKMDILELRQKIKKLVYIR